MNTPAPLLVCTCPSGDGSLRWPCRIHQPAEALKQLVDALQKQLDEAPDPLEIRKLRTLAACAYQLAGVHDAPEIWLDRLSEGANGEPLPDPDTLIEELLPYEAEVAKLSGNSGEVFGWVRGDAFVDARYWTADTPPQGWTRVYRTTPPSAPVGVQPPAEAVSRGEKASRLLQAEGWNWEGTEWTRPPAEAQAQGGGGAELRHMVAKLAAHVRPTCGELWTEAERLLNSTAPPSAPVVDGYDPNELLRAAMALIRRGHSIANDPGDEVLVQRIADHLATLAKQPAAVDGAIAALRDLHDRVLPAALRYHAIGPGYIEEAQEVVTRALSQQPAAVDGGVPDGWVVTFHYNDPRQSIYTSIYTDEASVRGLLRASNASARPFRYIGATQPGGSDQPQGGA